MTVHPSSAPVRALTVAAPDPGNLIDAMPREGVAWVRRGEGMIAWGEAARIDVTGPTRIDDAHAWWRQLIRHATIRDEVRERGTGPLAFGSFSFADNSAAGGTLIVPRYVWGRRGGTSWFTSVTVDGGEHPTLTDALGTLTPPAPLGMVREEPTDPEPWHRAVTAAIARIGQGTVDKVVLARAVDATAQHPIDSRTVVARLAEAYPTCWTFHVDGLVGATPELLARVDHGLVASRVLAGTIRMTGNDVSDLARAGALARSSKDREEHLYAVTSVTEVLEAHCGSVNVPEEPSVLHLPNVMHLATDVTGVLSHHASALELVGELHPSAAVCGTPTVAAAHVIDQLENLDRERYAGPVGWIDSAGEGEWCIGLRSAAISRTNPHRVRMFAGCGIVAASHPESEWLESEAKLEPMRQALGII